MADVFDDNPDLADKYPLHKKMREMRTALDDIAKFLEWCEDQRLIIVEAGMAVRDAPTPARYPSIASILSAYSGIDLQEVAKEKDALLEEIRFEQASLDTYALRRELDP